ncbi:hypothetical protein BV898_19560 [Hypsibius exemplaris]|uniref:Uncharacterized protein n=1 Tax=Hypsibius exemplaris TaxID=2072580 RepID=A0A9X6RP85_HYPEX|nr:hypothetical protein BV898_19560 [Hypsibius exemplaris]
MLFNFAQLSAAPQADLALLTSQYANETLPSCLLTNGSHAAAHTQMRQRVCPPLDAPLTLNSSADFGTPPPSVTSPKEARPSVPHSCLPPLSQRPGLPRAQSSHTGLRALHAPTVSALSPTGHRPTLLLNRSARFGFARDVLSSVWHPQPQSRDRLEGHPRPICYRRRKKERTIAGFERNISKKEDTSRLDAHREREFPRNRESLAQTSGYLIRREYGHFLTDPVGSLAPTRVKLLLLGTARMPGAVPLVSGQVSLGPRQEADV